MQSSSQHTFSELTLIKLQEELTQARIERKKLEEDTVPRKIYQELQQQMRTIHEAKAEAHEK